MENREFVKIEDKKMPVDEFRDIDFEMKKNYQAGFTNLVFLFGVVSTFLMWMILLFLGK